jgi:hypothetical protein
MLSATNSAKANIKWLRTGERVNREEVERAIKEQVHHSQLESKGMGYSNGSPAGGSKEPKRKKSRELEGKEQ